LKDFKSGAVRVLVATDIAARGIDVQGIELVINFDLPDETENYIHRIGRTGRAGQKGHAITFCGKISLKPGAHILRTPKFSIPMFYTLYVGACGMLDWHLWLVWLARAGCWGGAQLALLGCFAEEHCAMRTLICKNRHTRARDTLGVYDRVVYAIF
jgi:hypothetical protein